MNDRLRSVRLATATLTAGAVTALIIALPTGAADAAPPGSGPDGRTAATRSQSQPATFPGIRKPAVGKRTVPGITALPTREEIEAIAVPLDRELAGVVRMLKAAGIDQMALQAAQVIIASNGQLTAESLNAAALAVYNNVGKSRTGYAGRPGDRRPATGVPTVETVRSPDRRNARPDAVLRTLTPQSSPICTRPTSDNPLGLATPVGRPSGPWPVTEPPRSKAAGPGPVLPRLAVPATLDPGLITTGEVAFALIPAAPEKTAAATTTRTTATSTTTAGTTRTPAAKATEPAKKTGTTKPVPAAPATGPLRIAWLNTTTLQGGFADLVTDVATGSWLRTLAAPHGLRLAPVKSRYGTELAVVSRTAGGDERSCSFVPAISLTGV